MVWVSEMFSEANVMCGQNPLARYGCFNRGKTGSRAGRGQMTWL